MFAESIMNAGMRDSFEIEQLSGKPGEKWKHCQVSVGGRRQSVCLFC